MLKFRYVRGLSLFVCLLALVATSACAQGHPAVDPHHVDGSKMGGTIDLTSAWLLQQGDDPRYADPRFDDSGWKVVRAGKKLASYGLTDVDRVWYRTHVKVAPGQRNLSLLIRYFGGGYEIYVNGMQAGSMGLGPQGGVNGAYFDRDFAIPDAAVGSGDLTIAVRASIGRFSERGSQPGGFTSMTQFLLGTTPVISDETLLYTFRSYASNTFNIVMELMVPLIALALALTLPKEREYFALASGAGAAVLLDILVAWRGVTGYVTGDFSFIADGILSAIQIVAMLEFVRLVLGLRRNRWWAGYEWTMGTLLVIMVPWLNHAIVLGSAGNSTTFIFIVRLFAAILSFPLTFGMPVLAIWVWWKRNNRDALLLFVPLFLQAIVGYTNFAITILNRFHLTELNYLPSVPIRIFLMQWSEVATFFFSISLLLFLVLRTVRIARSRAAMASDLHAVQSVQEILLARASHPTPGFRVESVYHPASEVGGDFFLVSPGPDGSLTAIVGDVSGKGLVAAMRVSMILGVLRREEQREPEAILRNLNEALMMQGEMGFTTACCVRLERDGRYTIGNAGHINPYVGGKEVSTPSSLPLGMVEEQQYEHVSGYLPAGKTLVLMSDGVVEARSAKGELYGFERLPQLTLMAAQDIADVAQRFGQEDDITVLTVACGA